MILNGRQWDLPVLARGVSIHAKGLGLRGVRWPLPRPPVWPFVSWYNVGTPVANISQLRSNAARITRALEAAIREYLAITNEAPTPFVWTKTANEILASVARYCQPISNSEH